MNRRRLTKAQQAFALRTVAAWLGPRLGHDGPAPTGDEAAANAEGPVLVPDWDWPGTPTPTILLEGGYDYWAVEITSDINPILAKRGIWSEPYAGYALCLYRED